MAKVKPALKAPPAPKTSPASKAKEKSAATVKATPVGKKLAAPVKSSGAPIVSKKAVKTPSKIVESSAIPTKTAATKAKKPLKTVPTKLFPSGKASKTSTATAPASKTTTKTPVTNKAVSTASVRSSTAMTGSASSGGGTIAKAFKSKAEDLKALKNSPPSKGKAAASASPVNDSKKSPVKKMGLVTAGSKTVDSMAARDDEKETPPVVNNGPPTDPKILAKIRSLQSDQEKRKDFAQPPTAKPVLIHSSKLFEQARDPVKDRLILMVRDPYWLHACWDITRKSVERAKASLSGHWHAAKPVLRLLRTEDNTTTSNSESVFRDVPIHGGVRNWYIDVEDPQTTFRILLGYLFGNGRFHELARSNPVTTPIPGSADATDDHWADIATDAERVYALSGGYDEESTHVELQQMMQEKLKRPVGTPAMSQFGSGAEGSLKRSKNFHFTLDAEMVVFGATPANAYVTLNGEPIKIRSDGTYSARVPLPNHRQVMAATSKSRDGLDEQTIVIAVERNTKIMEPLSLTEPDMN